MCPAYAVLHQCPCCDYFTLHEPGAWDICPVCFWEDGDTDLGQLDLRSGCNNGLTLREARENFRRLGACEPKMLGHVCAVAARAPFRYQPRVTA